MGGDDAHVETIETRLDNWTMCSMTTVLWHLAQNEMFYIHHVSSRYVEFTAQKEAKNSLEDIV
jgi:hypothetical protein